MAHRSTTTLPSIPWEPPPPTTGGDSAGSTPRFGRRRINPTQSLVGTSSYIHHPPNSNDRETSECAVLRTAHDELAEKLLFNQEIERQRHERTASLDRAVIKAHGLLEALSEAERKIKENKRRTRRSIENITTENRKRYSTVGFNKESPYDTGEIRFENAKTINPLTGAIICGTSGLSESGRWHTPGESAGLLQIPSFAPTHTYRVRSNSLDHPNLRTVQIGQRGEPPRDDDTQRPPTIRNRSGPIIGSRDRETNGRGSEYLHPNFSPLTNKQRLQQRIITIQQTPIPFATTTSRYSQQPGVLHQHPNIRIPSMADTTTITPLVVTAYSPMSENGQMAISTRGPGSGSNSSGIGSMSSPRGLDSQRTELQHISCDVQMEPRVDLA